MKKIRFLFEIFSMVTACVVVAVAVFTTVVDPADTLDPMILWQIPAVSFLCSLGSLIYPWDRTPGKRAMGIRIVLHYLLINVIVMLCGFWFQWYQITHLGSVLVMLFTIAVIFALVSVLFWTRDAGMARQMNERLKELQIKNKTE